MGEPGEPPPEQCDLHFESLQASDVFHPISHFDVLVALGSLPVGGADKKSLVAGVANMNWDISACPCLSTEVGGSKSSAVEHLLW